MARVLLILPTSTYRAPEFLAAAAALDVEVVTGSEQVQALANVMGDHFLHLQIDDPAAAADTIVEFAARRPLDAVVAVDDRGGLAAAVAAERLGLRGNSPTAVRATTNKALLRAALLSAGVSQPRHLLVAATGAARANAVADAAAAIGFPVVVKPVSLSGSRGVIRVDDAGSCVVAVARIEAILEECGRSGEPLLVEEYVPGDEVALEGLLRDGSLETLCLFDKPDPLVGPYFEETIYVTPSRHAPEEQRAIEELVGAACAALGLEQGPVHAEVRLTPTDPANKANKPVLIEVAARTIGGRCAKALQFATGERLEELVLAHALGHSESQPTSLAGAAGVMMLPIPSSGRLIEMHGRTEALAVPHIVGLELAIPRGGLVVALPEGDRYLGFLFAAGPTPETVERALRDAHRCLEFEIAPQPALSIPT